MGKTLRMKKLLHAPFTLKKNLLEMINREAAQAALGQPAHIMAKVNSLTDPKVIRALYKASQAGVRIDLVVRGMCRLRPGIPGSRKYPRALDHRTSSTAASTTSSTAATRSSISSADWMERNLDMRVETRFPVEGKKLVQRVSELETYPDRQHPGLGVAGRR